MKSLWLRPSYGLAPSRSGLAYGDSSSQTPALLSYRDGTTVDSVRGLGGSLLLAFWALMRWLGFCGVL